MLGKRLVDVGQVLGLDPFARIAHLDTEQCRLIIRVGSQEADAHGHLAGFGELDAIAHQIVQNLVQSVGIG